MNIPTVHNQANLEDIAKTVIMPGDPLRAKYIVEKYFDKYVCYNKVRGMYGYTGLYKGVRLSVQGSGMGIPSMGIYSKELFEGYNVDNIIRIGSAGSLNSDIKLKEIVVADTVDTDSNYARNNKLPDDYIPMASEYLFEELSEVIFQKNAKVVSGKVFTSEVFYTDKEVLEQRAKFGNLAVEMETLALYVNAAIAKKNALAMFTISDNAITGEGLSSQEREKGFDEMIEIALELAIRCDNKK